MFSREGRVALRKTRTEFYTILSYSNKPEWGRLQSFPNHHGRFVVRSEVIRHASARRKLNRAREVRLNEAALRRTLRVRRTEQWLPNFQI